MALGRRGQGIPSPKELGHPSLHGDKSYFPPDRSSCSAIEVENRGRDLPRCPLILLIKHLRLVWCSQMPEPGIPAPWELGCVAAPGRRIWPRGCNPQPLSKLELKGFTSPKGAEGERCFCQTSSLHRVLHQSKRSNLLGPHPAGCWPLPGPKALVGETALKS